MPYRGLIAACFLSALLIAGCSSPFSFPEPPRPSSGGSGAAGVAPTRGPTPDARQPAAVIARPTATPSASAPDLAATLTALNAHNRGVGLNPDSTAQVLVLVPSALGAVFYDLGEAYMGSSSGTGSFQMLVGSLNGLIEHIRGGGALDAVISDDPKLFQVVQAAGLGVGEPRVFARSRLSVITPPANPKQISQLKDLSTPGVRWLTATEDTQLGAATAQALDRAATLPAYGTTFRTDAERNVLIRLKRVEELLERLDDGQGDAAIVNSSDLTPDTRKLFRVFDIPEDVNPPNEYAVQMLKGPNSVGAATFVSYLQSARAQAVFANHGMADAAARPAVGASAAAAPASSTFSPALAVAGLITTPRQFTRDDIAALPQETIPVTFQTPAGPRTETFTGTRLLNLFNAAGGARLPSDSNNAKLRVSVRVVGADGSEVTFGWGTLDPDFGAVPVLVAIERDGVPLADPQGMARLVVPGDRQDGRSVAAVTSIELIDPGPHVP